VSVLDYRRTPAWQRALRGDGSLEGICCRAHAAPPNVSVRSHLDTPTDLCGVQLCARGRAPQGEAAADGPPTRHRCSRFLRPPHARPGPPPLCIMFAAATLRRAAHPSPSSCRLTPRSLWLPTRLRSKGLLPDRRSPRRARTRSLPASSSSSISQAAREQDVGRGGPFSEGACHERARRLPTGPLRAPPPLLRQGRPGVRPRSLRAADVLQLSRGRKGHSPKMVGGRRQQEARPAPQPVQPVIRAGRRHILCTFF